MIDFRNVTKSYAGEDILRNVSFRVNDGERAGIVGPNGAGKSTLFGIITGSVTPDSGSVVIPRDHRLGVMRQHIDPADAPRPLAAFTADAIPELHDCEKRLSQIETLLAGDCGDDVRDSLLREHGVLQTRLEHLGAYHLDLEARQALSSLGFPVDSFDRPLGEFSGGWQMRAALARVLISHPDVLLLDEPSNYLDVPAVEWLCRFLTGFAGTLLLISHDRFLLRKLTDVTFEVNAGTVTRYPGGYDLYRSERENRMKMLEAAKKNTDRRKEQMERVIDRFRAKSTKAALAKSMQKKLDKIEDVTLPDALEYRGVIRFPAPPPGGTEAFRFEHVTFGYEPDRLLFRDLDLAVDAGEKCAFIGYNGRGKTTLLKLLTGRLKPLAGRVVPGHHSVIGYQAQEFSDLDADGMSVFDAVRQALPAGASTANLMNVLGSFGFSGDAASKLCKVLSGGEKIRVQFARIFVNPPNLLVLDEPTTHLDVAARELLQNALREFPGTVCFVSHDIEFVRGVAGTVFSLENGAVKKYFGGYDYYLEKSGQSGPAAQPEDLRSGAPSSGGLAKDRRRARAQARQAISGQYRQAKEKLAALEKQLDETSEKKKVLIAKLASGMKLDFAALKRELAAVEKELAATEQAWETAAEEAEALRLENLRINSQEQPGQN
ncbi:MAG: ABC-F family ATP-binding cassette domain-containing protein [Lentisphaeria bacterium]|nr:ABC-F family ATP-binding cassette domain-containing protein [Lentisphaeria bacterium]